MRIPESPFLSLAGLALLAGALSTDASAATERVFIEYAPGEGAAVREAVLAEGGAVHYDFDRIGALAVSIDALAVERLAGNARVLSVEPDPKRYLAAKPRPVADEAGAQTVPYGVGQVQAPLVWAEGYEGAGVTVCIIDTGLYAAHEDIDDDFIAGGLNQTPDSDWFVDGYGHGTHVAGTVTAADNDVGVIGVSPGKVTLYAVKIFGDDGGWTNSSDLVAAAFACSDHGADVINMSLSGSSGPNAERKAFDALYHEDGVLSVAAASNDGTRQRVFPASYDSVISVAATDVNYEVADFSNQNRWVELAAPGVDVMSTVPFVSDSWLDTGDVRFSGEAMTYSPTATVTGLLADGGLCLADDPAGDWAGQIVLCQRGVNSFAEKAARVADGGGIAAVIYNNEPGLFLGTLGEEGDWIVTLSLSQEDGLAAMGWLGMEVSARSGPLVEGSGYEAWGGTSMATPHVAGVAALLWSANPDWTNVQIREAMAATALDLGDPGRDIAYGYGLVQAWDALQYLQQASKPGKGPKKD